MRQASLHDGQWSSVIARLSQVVDLSATARQFGAFTRPRKIRSAEDLLRLAFMYGPAHLSLRSTAAMADEAAIASVTDKAVLGRLRKCGDWLEHLLQRLLADQPGVASSEGSLNLALVDGSVICTPAAGGADWRLHARFDPGRSRFTDLVLSKQDVGERVDRTRIEPDQIMVQDRGYARVRDFASVLAAGSHFITRIGWRSLRLLGADGQPFDPLAHLPQDDQTVEAPVRVKGVTAPLRLIIRRIPPDKAARQRQRVTRKASKAGHKIDPRTQCAAGYLMVITSLAADMQPAEQIISLYRNRWQIELGFKRLKSLGEIDGLPASDPALARTWLLAHLIAAVLADEMANQIVGFPPSAGDNDAEDQQPSGFHLEGLDHCLAHLGPCSPTPT